MKRLLNGWFSPENLRKVRDRHGDPPFNLKYCANFNPPMCNIQIGYKPIILSKMLRMQAQIKIHKCDYGWAFHQSDKWPFPHDSSTRGLATVIKCLKKYIFYIGNRENNPKTPRDANDSYNMRDNFAVNIMPTVNCVNWIASWEAQRQEGCEAGRHSYRWLFIEKPFRLPHIPGWFFSLSLEVRSRCGKTPKLLHQLVFAFKYTRHSPARFSNVLLSNSNFADAAQTFRRLFPRFPRFRPKNVNVFCFARAIRTWVAHRNCKCCTYFDAAALLRLSWQQQHQ